MSFQRGTAVPDEMSAESIVNDTVRERILQAAQERFRVYGYGKTTMAEIAADVSMSAANLYRYFRNKQDIAAVCARQCMNELHTLLVAVVEDDALGAAGKLRRFVQAALQYQFRMIHEAPRLTELVESITQNHPQLIYERNLQLEALLSSIIREGVDSGNFVTDDVERSAAAFLKATVVFTTPLFMHLYTQEEFDSMAVDVVELLINGLRKC
jgi:AcrR family transcriptional regulator